MPGDRWLGSELRGATAEEKRGAWFSCLETECAVGQKQPVDKYDTWASALQPSRSFSDAGHARG
jgi:hypothetical protein